MIDELKRITSVNIQFDDGSSTTIKLEHPGVGIIQTGMYTKIDDNGWFKSKANSNTVIIICSNDIGINAENVLRFLSKPIGSIIDKDITGMSIGGYMD